jgi:hypothetical protein
MSFDGDVLRYVKQEGWDIEYKQGTVKTELGQTFEVEWTQANTCHDLLGMTLPSEKKIIVKQPCPEYAELYTAESLEEVGAHVLAHELGHADSYPLSIGLQSTILGLSIVTSLKNRSMKPFGYGLVAYGTCRLFVDEIIAETCAAAFHGAPFMGSIGLTMPDLVERVSRMF